MKVFVTGANGQLGYDVMRELTGRGFEAVGSDVTERSEPHYIMLDITDQQAVNEVIRTVMW